ncbi:MAG: Ig-like domain-containing protein, partial [bacterium]|nr:Ig-like domain-containing protein [bacterium]
MRSSKKKWFFAGALLTLVLTMGYLQQDVYAESVYKPERISKGALNYGEKKIYTGEKLQLKLTGATATEWVSNNPKAATVSDTGKVEAKSAGYANIVARVSDDEVYVCKLSVLNPELSKMGSFMFTGASQVIQLNGAKPKNWKSSNTSVATVAQSGKVTAKKKGTAMLTCTDTNGKKYQCKITVCNKSEADGYSVDQIKKKLGKYEMNKIYVKGEKAFCYYATNGAWGKDIPTSEDLSFELRKKYPNCFMTSDLKCIAQHCDARSAMSECDYSVYYMEQKVSAHSEQESDCHTIRTDRGDSVFNYFGSYYVGEPLEKEPVVTINKTNFPGLYRYLYPYDLDGDGGLSTGEIYFINEWEILDPVSDIKGIEQLSNLWYLSLRNYTGNKIHIPKGTKIESVRICPNTKKLVVNMPDIKSIQLSTYYGDGVGVQRDLTMDKVDLSKCKAVEKLDVGLGSCYVKVTLPSAAPKLNTLELTGISNTSLDLSKYAGLETFRILYSEGTTSIDLSKNKKLKEVTVSRCKRMSKNKVKLPQN